MFRKIINTVLSVVFIVSTTGFTLSKHYCSNKFVSFSINTEAESCCNMKGCCHTESEQFKLDNDFVGQVFTHDFQDFGMDFLFLISFTTITLDLNEDSTIETALTDLPPPPKIQTTLSLLQTYLC